MNNLDILNEEQLTIDDFIDDDVPTFKCCICGAECKGFGNNPYPVVKDENARCCDTCNDIVVIPARIANL